MSTDTDTARPVPRLARDAWRAWLATGIAMLPAIAGSFGYVFTELLADRRPDRVTNYFISTSIIFVVTFGVYQWLTWRVFAGLDADSLNALTHATTPRTRRARRLEMFLAMGPKAWSATAALLALASALAVALDADLRSQPVLVALALGTVITGWTMIVFAYALKYLRQHTERPGLAFPGRPELVWRDYFYLAVQVSTTFSTSDVELTTTEMRGTVTSQSIVAFVFNTVIVALLVSALLTFA